MKLLLVVVLSLVAAGSCAVIDPKCAWGESYWCSDLRAAKSCGAIGHCKMTVWKNQVVEPDNTEVCEFCESIISDVKKFVDDKRTETEISHFMTLACGIIPNTKISDECKTLIDGYIHEILDLISSGLNGQRICSLLLLCSGGAKDTVVHAPISAPVQLINPQTKKIPSMLVGVRSEPICGDCKKFFNDIKNLITANATESEVEQMIDSAVCSLLGSLEDECKTLIHEFLPEIMQILSGYYDPDMICGSLGICSTDLARAKNMFLKLRLSKLPLYRIAKESSTETCLVCKTVMTELQSLDRDKNVQTEVTRFIKTQLCARLGSIKTECEITVDLYGPELFELLASELDPATRCQSLGFCSALVSAAPLPPVPVKVPKVKDTTQCELCKLVVSEIESLIKTNATEHEILAALEKVCSLLPKTVADECKGFVDLYGPAIIELLIQEVDPAIVCQSLGICTTVNNSLPSHQPIRGKSSSETCLVCETIVQYLEALLEQNATIADIEAILNKICNFLPDTMRAECTDIVAQYGPLIVQYITTMESPEQVCKMVKACPSGSSVDGAKYPQEILNRKETNVIGNEQCSNGVAYWCENREHAEECRAVDYCKNYVWKN